MTGFQIYQYFFVRKICICMLFSDRRKRSTSRASVETSQNSLDSSLTEAADQRSTNNERLTPREQRYARRSGGLVVPDNQPNRRASSSTARSPTADTSASTNKTTDFSGQNSRKRRSTSSASVETHSKKPKRESSKSTSSLNINLSQESKQAVAQKKEAGHRRSPTGSTVAKKQTLRSSRQTISNLERGKEKAAKGDKTSSKATAGQPAVGTSAAVGHNPAKKLPQRSAATATAGAESSSSADTATADRSKSGRTVTRRAATKRGGALLSSSSQPTDTTGSCASSK